MPCCGGRHPCLPVEFGHFRRFCALDGVTRTSLNPEGIQGPSGSHHARQMSKLQSRASSPARRVEQRRAKVRPTTSDVSALSRCVANGRQTIPTFPLTPLKFRTAGFPQYGFKPVYRRRPSPVSPPAYTPLKGESDFRRCPAGSSLTMAISELLHATKRFNNYIRLALRFRASGREVPNLLCQSSATCRHQYSGGSSRCS